MEMYNEENGIAHLGNARRIDVCVSVANILPIGLFFVCLGRISLMHSSTTSTERFCTNVMWLINTLVKVTG